MYGTAHSESTRSLVFRTGVMGKNEKCKKLFIIKKTVSVKICCIAYTLKDSHGKNIL